VCVCGGGGGYGLGVLEFIFLKYVTAPFSYANAVH
jgi:hypothetical protein